MVWVDPFKAVAIGGVKLKVPASQAAQALLIIEAIHQNKLIDESGEYAMEEAVSAEIARQNEVLELKVRIRKDESLLERREAIQSELLSQADIAELIKGEKAVVTMLQKNDGFTWKQFLFELLDFDRSVFKYLRPKPVEYFLNKELVDIYMANEPDSLAKICPHCQSANVSYGYAIDYKWDVLYLILSFLIIAPFPLIRKKYHCYCCGCDFHQSKIG